MKRRQFHVLLTVLLFLSSPRAVTSMTLEEAEDIIDSHAEVLDGNEAVGSVPAAIARLRSLQEMDPEDFVCSPCSTYYRIDGLCNNLDNPTWGAAFMTYIRELPNSYQDGKNIPRLYEGGTTDPLPSARLVSTECLPSLKEEGDLDLDKTHSQIVMQFGQFFAHDLVETGEMDGKDCCSNLDENGFHPDTDNGGACYPIPIPDNDRHFKACMAFKRSISEPDDEGVSQQVNGMTSFVDLSAVYGAHQSTIQKLRSFEKGKLRVDGSEMLPQDDIHKCLLEPPSNLAGCPNAGDVRVNVFPGLTSMHLVWHREHNRLADKLAEVHPDWTDEKLFQEARRINIAQLQNVVYKEYLPAVLGQKVYDLFRLDKPARYDPDLNPTIINSFATAAYRFGHTQINNVYRFGGDNSSVLLQDTFFRPAFYCQKGEESHSQVMESLLKDKAEKVDDKFPEGVTDLLFVGVDSPGVSTDLPARNIQRGRDHGLPPYDEYLDLALSFFNGSIYVSDTKLPSCIDGLYSDTGDVDLFLGAVSEDPVPGGIVGPTFAYLIGLQFQNLREGDRFFFDLKDSAARFTKAQVESIKATTFSGIICRNSGLHMVQEKAFEIPGVGNPPEICENVPDVDITLW